MSSTQFFILLQVAFQSGFVINPDDSDWLFLYNGGYIQPGTSSASPQYQLTTQGQIFLMERFSKLLGL